jgi:hypothetical protein
MHHLTGHAIATLQTFTSFGYTRKKCIRCVRMRCYKGVVNISDVSFLLPSELEISRIFSVVYVDVYILHGRQSDP